MAVDENTVDPGRLSWRVIGRFDFDGHGHFWQVLPNEPGLYRLKFNDHTFYVGQGKSIFRRLGDYYRPGQGVECDHRVNRALKKYGGADVEVITGSNLEDVSVRHKIERAEIAFLRSRGVRILNGDPDCIENLQDRIEYHQDEIAKLNICIANLNSSSTGSSK